MTEQKSIRVAAYLDPDTARKLRVTAAERGTSVTALVREAVRMYLTSSPTAPQGTEMGGSTEDHSRRDQIH